VTFPGDESTVVAVDGVSLRLLPGRVTGVLGESGSGKSQLALALTGLTSATITGTVKFQDRNLVGASEQALNRVRGRHIAYVFQDPMASLNPYLRISTQLVEIATTHRGCSRAGARRLAIEMLGRVRIPEPARVMASHPHELSGGMRQRVMIAMAMMGDPDILIADEPTTALDATVQVQILDLLRELCDTENLAAMVISHDIGVVARIADDVVVMYAGRCAERGPVSAVLKAPRHPYTRELINSTPDLKRPSDQEIAGIPGQLPGPDVDRGQCLFSARCPRAADICASVRPSLVAGGGGRFLACHFPLDQDAMQ